MQKRGEIVLPVGTTRVDVNNIPSLIAEAMNPGCRDAGDFPPDMLMEYVDGIANAMPGRLDSELSGVELERAVKFRLTSLEKAYFTELMIAIPNGAQGKENGLKARSRRTKLLCLELKDITDAYVDIDDFRTYVTRNYPSIDVCLVDTQHQAASAKTVGGTAGVEPAKVVMLDLKPWLIADSTDPTPGHEWYTPARYFARQLVIDDSTLLLKKLVLADKVATSLKNVGIYKRGGKKPYDASTVRKAFVNVTLG